jgi:hypothetical protein
MKHNSLLIRPSEHGDDYSRSYPVVNETQSYRMERSSQPITSTIELLGDEELMCEYIDELYKIHDRWLSGEKVWKRRRVPAAWWRDDSDFFLNGVKSLLKRLDIDAGIPYIKE